MRIITGKARGLHLNVPKNYDVRPTADRVKESLFSIIGSKVVGAAVLDLFAGSGNLGLESWSRGARFVQFVDNSRMSLQLTDSNIRKCRAEADCKVLKHDAEAAVDLFLRDKIGFNDIPRRVRRAMDTVAVKDAPSLEDILTADRQARASVYEG